MPTVTIRLTDAELELIKSYAKTQDRSVSDVIRRAILDLIEDEYDLTLFKQAKVEYLADPVTFSHEELMLRYNDDDPSIQNHLFI
ncbi:MAG: DUF6290 family protein [Coriobacteriia bacterium]|nr:DUF6290 family protein [Coriobacteriia bacterium]